MDQELITLRGAIIAFIMGIALGLLAIALSVTVGCGGQLNPPKSMVSCETLQDHLVEVGCFEQQTCLDLIEKQVTSIAMPEIFNHVDADTYCDLLLATGALPVNCLMAADTVVDIMSCIE